MKFKTKIGLILAKAQKIELASQTLDNVTLYFMDSEELVEGIEVFEMNTDGEYVSFPDGSYSWGDRTVVVENGIVTSITTQEENSKDKKQKMEVDDELRQDVEDLKEVIEKVADIYENLGGDIETVKEELQKNLKPLTERIQKLELSFEEATKRSNKDFAKPTPGGENKEIRFDADKELAKFGIK